MSLDEVRIKFISLLDEKPDYITGGKNISREIVLGSVCLLLVNEV